MHIRQKIELSKVQRLLAMIGDQAAVFSERRTKSYSMCLLLKSPNVDYPESNEILLDKTRMSV